MQIKSINRIRSTSIQSRMFNRSVLTRAPEDGLVDVAREMVPTVPAEGGKKTNPIDRMNMQERRRSNAEKKKTTIMEMEKLDSHPICGVRPSPFSTRRWPPVAASARAEAPTTRRRQPASRTMRGRRGGAAPRFMPITSSWSSLASWLLSVASFSSSLATMQSIYIST